MASDKFIYNNTSEQETYSMESTQESSSLSVQTSVEGEQYSADIKVQNDALSVQTSDAGNEYDFSAVAETDKLNVSESEEGDEYGLDLTIYNDEMYLRGFLKSPSRYKFSLIIENDSLDVEQEENVAVGKRAYYTKEETLQLLSQKADWTASLAKYGIKDAYIEGRVIHLGGKSIAVPESGGSGSSWLDDYLLPIYDDFGNVMGIQSIVGIASDSFLSAKGLDDDSQMQGSFDEELMWQLLGTDINTKIIADKHISANIARKSDITSLGSQYLTIEEFYSMFRRVTDGDKTYIKAMLGIATESFLSAKGLDDDSAEEGGGFDEELMWIALGGSMTNKIVADQHLPANLVRTTRKVAGFSLSQDVTVTNLSDALSLSRYLLRNEFADWQTQLTALRELFNTMFELVPATSEEPQYIRAKLGVASDSFLSAKGMDDDDTAGSGFDEELMWMALGGSLTNKIIADSHISSNIARTSAFGNYYTKAEVAALIPNLSSYYTKEQTDRILTGYASIDFVNSSLSTATATFRGTFETVAALPTTNVNVNDYAFVIVEGEYRRYKYNGTSWVFEYTLNNSGYTAEQWSAVNSGITEDLVELIGINEGNIDLNARNIKTNADAIKTLTNRVNEFGESLTTLEGLFDSDGKVQNAVNADLLEGHAASYFATKARVDALDTGIGTRIGDLETEIETIRKDYINSGELTNAINALGVPALKTRVQNLETAVGDLDEFVSDFEETGYVTIATHSSAISGLDTRIKANATAISNLSTDYEGFDERLDSAEANISTNTTNITAQGKTIASHTTSINTLTSDVSGLKTSVSDLEDNKLNKSVWDSVFEIDANGNLKVKVGLYSPKFISSREADPNTGGGSGGAFSLYTWTQVKALTSEVGGVAPTAYALKQAYNEIGVSLDGKASTSSVAALTTRVASLESKATSVSVSQTLTTGTEIGKITIDGVSKALYAPSIAGLASETWVSNNYLAKSGGTISNKAAGAALTVHRSNTNYDSMISFSNDTDGLLGRIGISGTYNNQEICPRFYKADGTNYPLIHSGNVGNYALPLSGGTLTGNLTISRGGEGGLYIGDSSVLYNGANTRLFRNASTSADYGTYLINAYTGGDTRFILQDGVFFRDASKTTHAILHSGNIGSYNAGSANALTLEAIGDLNSVTDNRAFYSYFQALNRPSSNYATGISLKNSDLGYKYQLVFNADGGLFTRHYTSSWQPWKTIAFIDSNVASAYKLIASDGTDAVTIGTNHVNFHKGILLNGYDQINGSAGITLNWECGKKVSTTICDGQYGKIAIFNSSGNVLIGTTTDSGYKLDVKGKLGVTDTNAAIEIVNGGEVGNVALSMSVSTYARIQATHHKTDYDVPVAINPSGGNVGIGTTAPTYKLDVAGTFRTTGAATFSSNITATGTIYSATGVYSAGYVSARGADTSSDRRLKDNIAPLRNALSYVLGTNYVSFDWKDTRKKSIGIIAQEEMGREWGCLVQKHSETYSYLYGQHTALLGAALQEEDKKVEELKRRIQDLENEVKRLKQTS